MPYFSNVRDLTLIGGRCETHELVSSIGRLPTSIRSLTMKFVSVTNSQVLVIMGQLPNLGDSSLFTFKGSGFPDGAGEILRGRYGGKLELLLMDDFHASIVRSLLDAPAGLGFKSVKLFCNTEDDLPVYADLVAACQDTLTNLDISLNPESPQSPHSFRRHPRPYPPHPCSAIAVQMYYKARRLGENGDYRVWGYQVNGCCK